MSAHTPHYKNIQNYILNAIASGKYTTGAKIPTELELTKQFGVSRMTVNKAITELTMQNILRRIPGKGTFVTAQKSESSPVQVADIAAEIRSRGNIHSVKILKKEAIAANKSAAFGLGVFTGSEVYFCHIVHYENQVPLLLEKRYINPNFVPDFMEQDFLNITPSGYLLKNYGLSQMEHTIEAVAATDTTAEHLEISLGDPCLHITRRTWCNNNLISFAQFIASGNRYKLHSRSESDR